MTLCLLFGHLANHHYTFARETLNDIVMTDSLPIFNECVTKTFEIPKWRFRWTLVRRSLCVLNDFVTSTANESFEIQAPAPANGGFVNKANRYVH